MICILLQGLSIKLYFYYIYWNTLNWIYMYVWKVTFEIQLTPLQESIPNSIRVVATIGEGNGTPLQSSCLENPMDGGAWWAAVHRVTKSWTRLSDFTFPFHFQALEKEMATHSSVVAWRIPGMGEPGGLPSVGSHSQTRLKRLSSSSKQHVAGTRFFDVQWEALCWYLLRFGPRLSLLWNYSGLGPRLKWENGPQSLEGHKRRQVDSVWIQNKLRGVIRYRRCHIGKIMGKGVNWSHKSCLWKSDCGLAGDLKKMGEGQGMRNQCLTCLINHFGSGQTSGLARCGPGACTNCSFGVSWLHILFSKYQLYICWLLDSCEIIKRCKMYWKVKLLYEWKGERIESELRAWILEHGFFS